MLTNSGFRDLSLKESVAGVAVSAGWKRGRDVARITASALFRAVAMPFGSLHAESCIYIYMYVCVRARVYIYTDLH
jgi:hypothetical protein